MLQKIYIIGHKSPDLDTVAAAILYANFKNKLLKNVFYLDKRVKTLLSTYKSQFHL